MVHPYRSAAEREAPRDHSQVRLDGEGLGVHGIIALIGAIGLVVGATCSRSTELVLGGMMTLFAARWLVSEARHRWRVQRARAPVSSGSPPA